MAFAYFSYFFFCSFPFHVRLVMRVASRQHTTPQYVCPGDETYPGNSGHQCHVTSIYLVCVCVGNMSHPGNKGQWTMDNGQWTRDNGQRTVADPFSRTLRVLQRLSSQKHIKTRQDDEKKTTS